MESIDFFIDLRELIVVFHRVIVVSINSITLRNRKLHLLGGCMSIRVGVSCPVRRFGIIRISVRLAVGNEFIP